MLRAVSLESSICQDGLQHLPKDEEDKVSNRCRTTVDGNTTTTIIKASPSSHCNRKSLSQSVKGVKDIDREPNVYRTREMTTGGSIISDTTGERPVAESSSGSLDSWFTGMVESGELQQVATANYQPEQHESEALLQQPQTLPVESSNSSVISPSLNQLLNAPQLQASTLPPMMLPPPNPVMYTAGNAVTLPEAAAANSIPEFLYQLTKMLTDNNRDIIEWSNGTFQFASSLQDATRAFLLERTKTLVPCLSHTCYDCFLTHQARLRYTVRTN